MEDNFQDSLILKEKLIRAGALMSGDLAFNQAGDLSPSQKRWLMLETGFWIAQLVVDLGLIVVAWVTFYLQYNFQEFLIGSLFWSLVLGTTMLYCIKNVRPLWADLKANRVESISGIISKHYGFGNDVPQHQTNNMRGVNFGVKIRAQNFSVTPSIYDSIVEHKTYQVFYIPNTKKLINIEYLPASDAKKRSALAVLQHQVSSKAGNGE